MKYVGKIIEDVREHTGNTSYAVDATGATTSGLSQHLILSHIQDAQDHLATLVINTHARIFTATKEISMVAGQEGYSVPDNIHINNKIISVQYSFDGTAANYIKLKPKSIRERNTNSYSFADFYIRYQDQLLINPIPSSSAAKIRVHYYRTLDRVALRAGTVTAKTVVGGVLSAITLDTATDDHYSLARAESICINSSTGTVNAYNIPVPDGAYDTATGVWTGFASHTLASGEPVNVGDYVTVGNYTTTHSKLPLDTERYLRLWAKVAILGKDSSVDVTREKENLLQIEAAIRESYSDPSEDVDEIEDEGFLDGYFL